jgi:hypothetical protein
MGVENALTVKARELIFEDMDVVTQAAAIAGVDKMRAGFQVALLIQYDLGSIVNKIFAAEHLNDTQQKQEVKKLAAYWNQPNLGPTTLYDLRNVAAAFDRNFIKEQAEERLSTGGYLTWSHFKELQKLSSEKRQLSTLKQIRRHSWSANELALELQGKKEADVKRSGGRKPVLPKTPNAMLQKLFASIQQSDNYVQAVCEPLEGIFLEMPASDVDEQFIDNIDNTLERMGEAAQHIKDAKGKLMRVRTRSWSMLEKADAAATAAASLVAIAAKDAPAAEGGTRASGKKRVLKAKTAPSTADKKAANPSSVTSTKKGSPSLKGKTTSAGSGRKMPRRSGKSTEAKAGLPNVE